MKAAASTFGLFFAVLCLSAAQPTNLATSARPPASVCGRWVVKRVLRTANVQTSPTSLEKYLGVRALYSSSEMRFGEDGIRHPLYSVSRLSDVEFFRKSTVPLTQLGIRAKSVVVVEVRDSAGKDVVRPGTELFVRSGSEIITTWDGGYFELVRTGTCSR